MYYVRYVMLSVLIYLFVCFLNGLRGRGPDTGSVGLVEGLHNSMNEQDFLLNTKISYSAN